MLTGGPAFHGRTHAALAGSIMRDEPEGGLKSFVLNWTRR